VASYDRETVGARELEYQVAGGIVADNQEQLATATAITDARFLVPLKLLPLLNETELEVLGLVAQIPAGMDLAKAKTAIGKQVGISRVKVYEICRNSTFKQALKAVKYRLINGPPEPVNLAASAECEVLVEFTSRVLNPETPDEYRLKYGEAVLRYRPLLNKALPFLVAGQALEQKLDSEVADRIQKRIKVNVIEEIEEIEEIEDKGSAEVAQ